MTTGVMYDAAYVPLAAILARKPDAMALYTDGTHAASQTTVNAVRGAGIPIWPNHENAANELLGGAASGTKAAQHAVAAVLAWGCPADGSVDIVYSVDVNTPASQFPTVGAAFDAINTVHAGRFITKVYAEGALIDYLVAHGHIKPGDWLSGSSSFPGYNVNDGNVAVWQQVGSDIAGTDRDVITHGENMGLWYPAGFSGGGTLENTLAELTDAQVQADVAAAPIPWAGGTQPESTILNSLLTIAQQLNVKADSLAVAVSALSGALTADQAALLAAITKIQSGGGTIDEASFATDLTTDLLTALPPGIATAVAAELSARLSA